MRKLITIVLILISVSAYSQNDVNRTGPVGSNPATTSNYNKQTVNDANFRARLTLYIPNGVTATLNNAKDSTGAVYFATTDSSFNIRRGGNWIKFKTYNNAATALALKADKANTVTINGNTQTLGSNPNFNLATSDSTIAGGAFSSIPTVGFNPGVNKSAAAIIQSAFYQSQVPTASLSGGLTQELHSAGTYSGSISWTAGRQSATQPLSTIVVAGVTQSFTQPAAGASVGGTQSISMAYNTNATYTNTATTTDSKTASATTSFTWLPKRYWGRTSATSPSGAEILASAGGSNELSNSRAGTFAVTASGSNRVFFSYPASEGDVTSISVGGLTVTFIKTTISLTNASGYVQTYNIYTSPNASAGDITMAIN